MKASTKILASLAVMGLAIILSIVAITLLFGEPAEGSRITFGFIVLKIVSIPIFLVVYELALLSDRLLTSGDSQANSKN